MASRVASDLLSFSPEETDESVFAQECEHMFRPRRQSYYHVIPLRKEMSSMCQATNLPLVCTEVPSLVSRDVVDANTLKKWSVHASVQRTQRGVCDVHRQLSCPRDPQRYRLMGIDNFKVCVLLLPKATPKAAIRNQLGLSSAKLLVVCTKLVISYVPPRHVKSYSLHFLLCVIFSTLMNLSIYLCSSLSLSTERRNHAFSGHCIKQKFSIATSS